MSTDFWIITAACATYALFIIGFAVGTRRFEDEDITATKDTYHGEDKPNE